MQHHHLAHKGLLHGRQRASHDAAANADVAAAASAANAANAADAADAANAATASHLSVIVEDRSHVALEDFEQRIDSSRDCPPVALHKQRAKHHV
jgi:hypothetical protein